MGDCDCQWAAVTVHGVDFFPQADTRLAYGVAGSPLVEGALLLRQTAPLMYLSGRAGGRGVSAPVLRNS